MMMLPREIFTDHVKPFLDPEILFDFVCAWKYEEDMVIVLRWFLEFGLLDPYHVFHCNWNLLSWACLHNHMGIIDLLLEMKIDLHRLIATLVYVFNSSPSIDFHMNALNIVCYYNRLGILKKLMAYNPSVLTSANIHHAFEKNHAEMCEFLVRQALSLDPKLYLSVCRHNNVRLFQLLRENGCSITHRYMSGRTLLMYACMQECLEIVQDLLLTGFFDLNEQDEHANTALMYACQPLSMSVHDKNRKTNSHVKLQIVNALVDHGMDVNLQKRSGMTALFIAFRHSYCQIASYLLENGANINVQDHSGWDCLMFASYYGDYQTACLSIKFGIDLNQKNLDGMNALMFACRYKRRDIFDLILGKCKIEDLNVQDNIGYTSLMWACVSTPDSYMIQKLVKKGADVSLKTIHGSTALNLAYEYGMDDDNTLAMLMF